MSTGSSQPLPNVLILTPVKNAEKYLDDYVERIVGLSYPKAALSIGLLEGDSRDATWARLQGCRDRLEARCRRVTLAKRDFNFQMPTSIPRWAPAWQIPRRGTLARARNHLLFAALRDEEFIFWLDVDVVSFPQNLLETLTSLGLDIVQPHCVVEPGGPTFDRNAWTHHGTRHLDSYRDSAKPVRLDGVGGTALLIRADIHRDGLIFPPFRYGVVNEAARPIHPLWGQGEMETEGLGIMAADMGVQCWGLPNLEVVHDRS